MSDETEGGWVLMYNLFLALLAGMMSMTMLLMSIYIVLKILKCKVIPLSNIEFKFFSIATAIISLPLIFVIVTSINFALKPYGPYGILIIAALNIILCLLCSKICR